LCFQAYTENKICTAFERFKLTMKLAFPALRKFISFILLALVFMPDALSLPSGKLVEPLSGSDARETCYLDLPDANAASVFGLGRKYSIDNCGPGFLLYMTSPGEHGCCALSKQVYLRKATVSAVVPIPIIFCRLRI
jgi:hypothetical protein